MRLILIVRAVRGAGIEAVGAVVIHVASERIADVAARLNVDLVPRIHGNIELRRELEHSGPGLVRRFHLREVGVGIFVEVQLQRLPHVVLVIEPTFRGDVDAGLCVDHLAQLLDRDRRALVDPLPLEHPFERGKRCCSQRLALQPTKSAREILLAFKIQRGEPRQPTVVASGLRTRRLGACGLGARTAGFRCGRGDGVLRLHSLNQRQRTRGDSEQLTTSDHGWSPEFKGWTRPAEHTQGRPVSAIEGPR